MPFYLSEYIGAGTYKDPYRPVGADQPGWSAIDLRADGGATLDGGGLNACLLHVPTAFTDPKARFLADDKLESLTNPQKNFLQNRLGVDLSSPTLLRDIVATLMTNPPANGWKGIRPTPLRWEIWLGGLLWSAPFVSGGADVFDDFDRANATLSSPWVPRGIDGTMQYSIAGNRLRKNTDGDFLTAYSGSVSHADQWSSLVAPVIDNADFGPIVRVSEDGSHQQSAYLLAVFDFFISKWVAGAFSVIFPVTFYTTRTAGDRYGLNVIGSSQYGLQNGRVLHNGTTDTSISGMGDGSGIFIYPAYTNHANEIDDFRGGISVRSNPIASPPSVFTRSTTMTLASGFEGSGSPWDAIPTPATPIPAGTLVVISGIIGDANPNIDSITDLAGNVYTIIRQDVHNAGSPSRAFLAYSLLTNDLGPADSIIITESSGVNRKPVVIASSYEVPAGTLSLTGSGFAQDVTFPQSSNPAPSAVTALANNALCVSFVLGQPVTANPTFTPSSGLTQIANIEESSTTWHGYAEDGLVSAGSVAPAPVASASMYWTAYQAVFEVVAAPTSLPVDADFSKFPKTILRRA